MAVLAMEALPQLAKGKPVPQIVRRQPRFSAPVIASQKSAVKAAANASDASHGPNIGVSGPLKTWV